MRQNQKFATLYVSIFVKEWREPAVRDQSQDERGIYTGSILPEDNNPMSSVILLISIFS
jgi:hypothetical protein